MASKQEINHSRSIELPAEPVYRHKLSISLIAIVCVLFVFDALIYCTRLGCRVKIDANIIASPFDKSPAPPAFVQRDLVKVKKLVKSPAQPKSKPVSVASSGRGPYEHEYTDRHNSRDKEYGWSGAENRSRYHRSRRYRRFSYTVDERSVRHTPGRERPKVIPREPAKRAEKPLGDAPVDSAFIPVDPAPDSVSPRKSP